MVDDLDSPRPKEEEDPTFAEALPLLPIKYEMTDSPEVAKYTEWRVSPVIFEGMRNEPHTDDEMLESVKKQHEAKEWYTSEYWRKKGLPYEQVEFVVDGRRITIYNYNQEKPFTEEHLAQATEVIRQFASRFPQILDQIRWILIDDHQVPTMLGDPEKYPTNGYAMKELQAFRFFPRGMEMFPYRLEAVTNFEGVFAHELTHLIQNDLEPDWGTKFKWEHAYDHEDEWEIRETPTGETRWFNKDTDEMAPQGQFPLQPDQCVTYYAK